MLLLVKVIIFFRFSEKANDFETSTTFYVVALKNDSIRFLNASKLAGRQLPKRLSFLN